MRNSILYSSPRASLKLQLPNSHPINPFPSFASLQAIHSFVCLLLGCMCRYITVSVVHIPQPPHRIVCMCVCVCVYVCACACVCVRACVRVCVCFCSFQAECIIAVLTVPMPHAHSQAHQHLCRLLYMQYKWLVTVECSKIRSSRTTTYYTLCTGVIG